MNVNLDGIIGLVIDKVFVGCGSMFELDIGRTLTEEESKAFGRSHEWRLWVQCSEWELLHNGSIKVYSECDPSVLESSLCLLKGLKVLAYTLPASTIKGASIRFSNGMELRLNMHRLGKNYDSWCFFTPGCGVIVQNEDGRVIVESE